MIRINLLGIPNQKRGKRPAMSVPTVSVEGPMVLVAMFVIAVLAVGGNGFYYWHINQQRAKLNAQVQAAEAENRMLSQVKTAFFEKQKQADQYKRRVDVIDQLRANQMGPVNLLSTIGQTVNSTDSVWLNIMRDEGSSISIEGTALSANAVANLMQNLKKTGYFKNVEIKETFQDEKVKDMQAFVFTLACEKQVDQKKS